MEEARHWVWAKQNHGLHHHVAPSKSSYGDSWEEQAFAEDSSGLLGGCIWPPRSYSCSFCRREFRSAQALGGHMNVHRRDRARLKQSPSDLDGITMGSFRQNSVNNPSMINPTSSNSVVAPIIPQFPSQVRNPNSNFDEKKVLSLHRSSSPSSSSFTLYENCTRKESDKRSLVFGPSTQISSSNSSSSERPRRPESSREYHHVKTDLSVSLNLVLCRSCPSNLSGGYDITESHDHGVSTCKRRRVVYEEERPSSYNPNLNPSGDRHDHGNDLQKEVLKRQSPCSDREELDLELRLGVR